MLQSRQAAQSFSNAFLLRHGKVLPCGVQASDVPREIQDLEEGSEEGVFKPGTACPKVENCILAADERRWTRIRQKVLIGVNPRSSAAYLFSILRLDRLIG